MSTHVALAFDTTEVVPWKGGEIRSWPVEMKPGETVTVTAEQQGIDIYIEVVDPAGKPLLRMDNPNGAWGVEDVAWVAEESGTYRVEVTSSSPNDAPGKVALRISEPRSASAEERKQSTAFFHWSEGDRLRRQGEHRAASGRLEQALSIWHDLEDPDREMQLLVRLGKVAELQHAAERARRHYENGGKIADASNNMKRRVLFENLLARVALDQNELEVAKQHIDAALAMAQKSKDPLSVAKVQTNLAPWLYKSGRIDEAVRLYLELGRFWEEQQRPLENAEILQNLGTLLTVGGHVDQAVSLLRRSAELQALGRDEVGRLHSEINLGDALFQSRAFHDAYAVLADAESRLGSTPIAPRYQARLYLYKALAHSRRTVPGLTPEEKLGEVLAHLDAARTITKQAGLSRGTALVDFNEAVVQMRGGRSTRAFELFQNVYQAFDGPSDDAKRSQALLGMAMAQRRLGQMEEALEYARRALSKVETFRTALSSRQLRLWFLASKDRYFEELTEILFGLHLEGAEPPSGPGYLDRAFDTVQARRARGFLDSLDESMLRSRVDSSVLEAERRTLEALREVDLALRAPDVESLADLEAERRRLLLELDGVRGKMRQDDPQFAVVTRPKSLSVESIQEHLLEPGDRLIVYGLGEERSFVWSLDKAGPLRGDELASREELAEAVDEALRAVRTVSPERRPHRERALRRLGSLLLDAALKSGDRPERLILVTDGMLDRVPFSALRLSASPGSGQDPEESSPAAEHFVIEEFEVVSIPSIAALDALRREAPRRPSPHYGRLVVGDPVYSLDDERLQAQDQDQGQDPGRGRHAEPREDTGRTEHDTVRAAARRAGLSGEWRRLEFSGREADALADPRPLQQSLVLKGFDARKGETLKDRLQGSRLIHFATHGVADGRRPELSALVLSLVDPSGRPINGYLYAYEIYGMRLSAELVVLSACETGIGPTIAGEGVQGLSRAFLYAGAPRLVTSLWSVDDESTAEWMTSLYRRMSEDRLRPSAALRAVQVDFIRSASQGALAWSEPYYWAPFAFWGDWRSDVARATASDSGPIEKEETGAASLDSKGTDVDFPIGGQGSGEISSDPDQYVNGIDIDTGRVVGRASEPEDAETALSDLDLHPRVALNLQWWAEHHSVDDPLRLPVFSVDPDRLDQAGWVALFGPDVTPEIEEALAPLLRLRSRQAGRRYMDPIRLKDGATSMAFRRDHEIGFGPADPDVLPYYILLVGDPERVPFELQYSLDVQYAVGRLHLDSADEYRRYAELVERLETDPPPTRDAAIFGVAGPEPEEILLSEALVRPLARRLGTLKDESPSSPALRVISSTLKRDFEALLRDPPGFLFAAGHGLFCRSDHPHIETFLGALVCSDHHLSGTLDARSYVSGRDLDRLRPDLQGLITFLFACYGGGAPRFDTFRENATGPISEVAPRAMVSHLAKRMLAHGAQAFVGHVDRAWSLSFDWSTGRGDQTKIFDSVCRQLLSGARLGHALEWINQRYAEGAAELTEYAERITLEPGDGERIRRIRKATLDARNYLVIGDPAVRLPGFLSLHKD